MELQFLGTGAGVPAKHRNVTSIALKLLEELNEVWLFDCGEATQQQILRTTIRPRKITKIFITHLHGDHLFGLPGLLSSRSFQGGELPLTIYGPKGVANFVRTSLQVSDSHLNYPLHFVELLPKSQATLVDTEKFRVIAQPLDHRISCFGYRIEEQDQAGQLQVEALQALNIPAGPLYGKLKKGETVLLEDGREINGLDYVGAARKGRIVTILGDTRKHPNAQALAEDADVLVHESTFEAGEQKLAKAYYHSTTEDAALVAQAAGVKQLILTHISARYLAKDVQRLAEEAQAIFPETVIAKDFDTFEIAVKK